jgi:amino acid adenylation domain-containing protein
MRKDAAHLSSLLSEAAGARPDHRAVEDELGRSLTYGQLERSADRLAARLARWGVGRGDRVGLWLPKSLEAVVAIHGVVRTGAAYVPVDPTAPPRRGAGILADARIKAAVITPEFLPAVSESWPICGPKPRPILVGAPVTLPRETAAWEEVMADGAPSPLPQPWLADDPAYVLYTSGSTGQPKGVVLSHANAFCFLDWCQATFELCSKDRFASHAPFHFDLSVFDLFASCRTGATLVLIGEALGKDPVRLGTFLAKRAIDVWYSAPSILALLAEYGGLDRPAFPAPRLVLFAGEVFPIQHLRRLRRLWSRSTLWNLYGPTETNVCTAFPIPEEIHDDRLEPFPIGRPCPPFRVCVVDESARPAPAGEPGELWVSGTGVMRGYFGRPDLTEQAIARDSAGVAWYRTGDVVTDDGAGLLSFHGRRDRMVKKRGYRIELGEIESALYQHEGVDRAAVVATTNESGVSISAFLAMKPERKCSIIAMKRHCTLHLPHYMVPDQIAFLPAVPSTSTDKVDYHGLQQMVGSGRMEGGDARLEIANAG